MQETGYRPGSEEHIEAMGSTQRTLTTSEQKCKRTGAQAENPQNFPQAEGGALDKARSLADKQEVTGGAVSKQTMISGEIGEEGDAGEPNNIRARNKPKEGPNVKHQHLQVAWSPHYGQRRNLLTYNVK